MPSGVAFEERRQARGEVISLPMRRFPPPWTVERIPGGFKVLDAEGQSLAYVYGVEGDPTIGKTLTLDEAKRIASNIAKLPELLSAK